MRLNSSTEAGDSVAARDGNVRIGEQVRLRHLSKLNERPANAYVPSEFLVLAIPREASDAFELISGNAKFDLLPCHVAHSADFVVALWYSRAADAALDPASGTMLLLHGDVFIEGIVDRPARVLLDWYLSGGSLHLANRINGACAVVIVSHDELSVVIDRISSRKVFQSKDTRDRVWLSSSLELQPTANVDPAGVASLVINRCQYLGRTVFEGVTSLERAKVHSVRRSGISAAAYWNYALSSAGAAGFEKNLPDRKAELAHLVRQAVRRRASCAGRVFVSLSGGVDSRCILGSLLEVSGMRERISAISYGRKEDDDGAVAREICAVAGVSHRLSSAREDLCALIRQNGELHEGQVFFYLQGLDGFAQLASEFDACATLFVGDECFGWQAMQLDSFDDTLTKGIGIRSPASVPAYYSYGAHPHTMIEEQLQADIEVLRDRCRDIDNWHDCKDFLYLDQRLANMLLPWRERYAGHYARLVNPLLDNDVLDFMKQTPTHLRLGKCLFREVAQEMFPELFATRVAKEGGVSADPIAAYFRRERQEIADLIDGFESRLDAVFPPHVLHRGLENVLLDIAAKRRSGPTLVASTIAAMHQKWRAVRRNVLEHRGGAPGRPRSLGAMSLSPVQFATVLQLRWYLRKPAGTRN